MPGYGNTTYFLGVQAKMENFEKVADICFFIYMPHPYMVDALDATGVIGAAQPTIPDVLLVMDVVFLHEGVGSNRKPHVECAEA